MSVGSKPHFTTIADFIASMNKEVVQLFLQVLMACDHQQLIGKEMFAIDGCKLPSNASKEWSGTKVDFSKKIEKIESAIMRMVEKQRSQGQTPTEACEDTRENQYKSKL